MDKLKETDKIYGASEKREAPIDIDPALFRRIGTHLVNRIADFLENLEHGPVTPGESLDEVRSLLKQILLEENGTDAETIVNHTAELVLNHSLFNSHPRFLGYITSASAPIGMLADFLAAAVNPNVGGWALSPVASEIEVQTIRWIADVIGYDTETGGLLVSGGNMANFIGFLAARRAKTGAEIRNIGLREWNAPLTVYVSQETHTWIQKAADLFGLGTDAIRWIKTGPDQRMLMSDLEAAIKSDIEQGYQPFLIVGTAGSVATGAWDPLADIAELARRYDLWFHVDGAYGAFAANLPGAGKHHRAIALADSVALDPHKWLYTPLEAGCVLVKKASHLAEAFSFRPSYYHLDEDEKTNFYEYGFQNSRGFRALKVWMALRQTGKKGVMDMIRQDIGLMHAFFEKIKDYPELEGMTCNLSIATFRYIPKGVSKEDTELLNQVNTELLERLQEGGEVFLSNALINGQFLLRACIVNFRTRLSDMMALPEIVIKYGSAIGHS